MTNTHTTEVRIDRCNRYGLIFWAQQRHGSRIVKSEGFRRPQEAETVAASWAGTYGARYMGRAWKDGD